MSRDRNVVKQFFKSMSNELSGVEFFGYLGNREGVVKADNLNNVWVLLFNGSVVKARNKVAPLVSRTPVAVGYTKEDPKLLQVLRVMNVYDRNTQPYLPPHAKSHSWPGADTVSIRAEQIVPGLALPSGGMVVKYYGWPYEIDGAWYYIRSREFDLTSYIPDTGAVWVSVEVDDAGDVTYVESDPADSKDLLTFAMLPVVPETRVMLFAVKCYTGQTEVVKTELDNDIFDPRLALHARKAAAVWGEITGDIEDQTDLVEYIDDRMTGLWDDRGNYDASGNAYPSSGGSGTAGAILKGDIWTISVAGTLPTGRVVEVGDTVRALVDSPGSTEANWAIGQNNIGYVAENSANKTDAMAGNTASSTKYLSAKGVYDWAVATFQAVLTAAGLGDFIVALTGKTTPVDADTIILSDSAASDDAKKVTWANIKATLKTYFDGIYQAVLTAAGLGDFIVALTGKTTPVDADTIILSDSAASDDAKKVTWANIKATLKTYNDTLYKLTQTGLKTAAYTAVTNDYVICDANGASGDFAISLPSSPSAGTVVGIALAKDHATHNVTIDRNGSNVDGGTDTGIYTLCLEGDNVIFEYVGSDAGWVARSQHYTSHSCSLSKSTQTINDSTNTKITLDTENYDTGDIGDPTTNNRVNIRRSGKYQVIHTITVSLTDQKYCKSMPYKNGALALSKTDTASGTTAVVPLGTGILSLSAGDYIELYAFHNYGSSRAVTSSNLTVLEMR